MKAQLLIKFMNPDTGRVEDATQEEMKKLISQVEDILDQEGYSYVSISGYITPRGR